jgi:two-component system, cell cycle sensor histidine kinase and response regulator CckA
MGMPNRSGTPRRVIIVDDDRDFSEGLRDVLESQGYAVRAAYDVPEAEAVLAEFSPLVFLLDVRLGRTSGIDAIETLRKHAPSAAIVVMTAYADTDSAIQALEHGAYAYLRKPFEIPELLSTLERIAERALLEREKEAAVAALRENELLLRLVLENGSDVVLWLDRAGAVRYASPSVQRVLGFAPGEMVGQALQMYIQSEDVPRVEEYLNSDSLVIGPDAPFELRLQRKDGEWRTLEALGRGVIDPGGSPTVILNARDITERTRADAELRERDMQLRQAQKMEAIGRLAGGVAHDFNNLLQAIQGFTDLTLSSFDLPPEARENLIEVTDATHRAAKLVRQLLSFSRREDGEFEAVELRSLIHDLGNLLRRLIGPNIELAVDIKDEPIPLVWADPGAVEQVIINLCVNARDAMPEGGAITVTVSACTLTHEDRAVQPWVTPGKAACIEVSDTGHGIPFDLQERIFEPFFTTKDARSGTGLGLATVYAIAQQHGAVIRVDSAPGRGSVFRFCIPRASEHRPSAVEMLADPPVETPHGRILVVDDDPLVQQLATRILEGAGYPVVRASDGAEALEVYERERDSLDLVLLDVVMPKLGGRAVGETLRADDPNLPILYTTGYSQEVIDDGTNAAQGIEILRKPYRPRDLLDAVARLLNARQRRGASD